MIIFKKLSGYVDMVVGKILDQQAVHRARIHPISVLLASSVYEQGKNLLSMVGIEPISHRHQSQITINPSDYRKYFGNFCSHPIHYVKTKKVRILMSFRFRFEGISQMESQRTSEEGPGQMFHFGFQEC